MSGVCLGFVCALSAVFSAAIPETSLIQTGNIPQPVRSCYYPEGKKLARVKFFGFDCFGVVEIINFVLVSISGFKFRIAGKKLASRIQQPALSEEVAPVESVVVILDSEETELLKCFRDLKGFLRVKDENFRMIFSVASKVRKQDSERIYFDPSEITWKGNFRGELKEIRDRRFHLLICFTKEDGKAAKFLSAVLDAGLKVSRQNSENAVFDLSISTGPEEAEIFTEELKKYLRILNKIKE